MSGYEVTMIVFGALGLVFTALTFVVLLIINIKK